MRKVAVFLALTAMLCVPAAALPAMHSHHLIHRVCSTAHMMASEVAVIHVIRALERRASSRG
ncbi:MAG TPA: hypothetical protein VHC72_03680 [Bryobacteraceae bacterium]|nr:hypothetical protein [Bryobacteraceae bacterium]